jgi:hypothetical protein
MIATSSVTGVGSGSLPRRPNSSRAWWTADCGAPPMGVRLAAAIVGMMEGSDARDADEKIFIVDS